MLDLLKLMARFRFAKRSVHVYANFAGNTAGDNAGCRQQKCKVKGCCLRDAEAARPRSKLEAGKVGGRQISCRGNDPRNPTELGTQPQNRQEDEREKR